MLCAAMAMKPSAIPGASVFARNAVYSLGK
jgi:hypothetical protein